jgi:predicted short-subunit dehydrogenase-like oxidoreductase (DUF2520 family)
MPLAIIGGGRMGRALATALAAAGERVHLWSPREATGAVADAVGGVGAVILAVPDDAITEVAEELARAGAIDRNQVVLHLSGLLTAQALTPLLGTGAALGSWHPLQTISDPETAGERWRGAVAAVEGDARAVAEACRLSLLLGLEPVTLSADAKVAYHVGAVFASNYVIVLAATASRLAEQAGVPRNLARRMYLPLLRGALANLAHQTPEEALTGPIRRGDLTTIRVHLEAMAPEDRELYARLGLNALALARRAGLEPARAEAVERVLRDY